MLNPMDSDSNSNFKMYNKFLISFDIRSMHTAPNGTALFKAANTTIDIFDDEGAEDEDQFALDIDKLNKYISFKLSTR